MLQLVIITNASGTYIGRTPQESLSSKKKVSLYDAWMILPLPRADAHGNISNGAAVVPVHLNQGPCKHIHVENTNHMLVSELDESTQTAINEMLKKVNEAHQSAKIRKETGLITSAPQSAVPSQLFNGKNRG